MADTDSTEQDRPIFILGTARSGTTALSQGIMHGLGGFPYSECAVLPLLKRLLDVQKTYFKQFGDPYTSNPQHLLSKFPREELAKSLKGFFSKFYSEEFKNGFWVDKTANSEMIEEALLVASLFPEARFISIRRRGIDMVASRIRKFPKSPFEANCREWVRAIEAWEAAKGSLKSPYIEVEQQEMVHSPDSLASRVGVFLGLSKAETDRMADYWKTERPQSTTSNADPNPISIEDTSWTDEQKACFLKICGPTMERLGYALSQPKVEGDRIQIPERDSKTDE